MINYKIAAIVVTYNRKELLKKCINAILNQSFLPSIIYIIDNASTDGTDSLFESKQNISPLINYIRLIENGGGAQGFYHGLKTAHETNAYDAYWVMDDDGQPDKYCLENLIKYLPQYDYLAPLVLDIDNKNQLAFNYKGSFILKDLEKKVTNNIIEDWACPFNGILYSKKLIEKIGYPKKEMFIWGDEANYHLRAKDSGSLPYMIMNALHFHPKEKTLLYKSITRDVIYIENKLKTYCFHRNIIYNNKMRWKFKDHISHICNYFYYILIKKMNISLFCTFLKACIAGYCNKFDGHKKYLK